MFCTTLIASYKRPKLLECAISSLRATARNPGEHEVLVRLSRQDPGANQQEKALPAKFGNVRVFVGDHLGGYSSLGDYFTELAAQAVGQWVNIFDDDMTLDGQEWDQKLRYAPTRAFVVCEKYQLGPSKYGRGSCDGPGIAWFLPRNCWQEYGASKIEDPPDTWMRQLLVNQHGWPIHRLPGITLNHRRMHEKDKDR